MRLKTFQIALGLTFAGSLMSGCHSQTPETNVSQTGKANAEPAPKAEPPKPAVAEEHASDSPVKDAVNKLMEAKAGELFPKGSKVIGATLKDGVATLDMSVEFGTISTMGETTESMAQKSMRATLAKFPSVEKLGVWVNGKPFTSEATDWGTPFPVRGGESSEGGAH